MVTQLRGSHLPTRHGLRLLEKNWKLLLQNMLQMNDWQCKIESENNYIELWILMCRYIAFAVSIIQGDKMSSNQIIARQNEDGVKTGGIVW